VQPGVWCQLRLTLRFEATGKCDSLNRYQQLGYCLVCERLSLTARLSHQRRILRDIQVFNMCRLRDVYDANPESEGAEHVRSAAPRQRTRSRRTKDVREPSVFGAGDLPVYSSDCGHQQDPEAVQTVMQITFV
jgi:hypothetical protein